MRAMRGGEWTTRSMVKNSGLGSGQAEYAFSLSRHCETLRWDRAYAEGHNAYL